MIIILEAGIGVMEEEHPPRRCHISTGGSDPRGQVTGRRLWSLEASRGMRVINGASRDTQDLSLVGNTFVVRSLALMASISSSLIFFLSRPTL